jgi:hypothetical protein
MTTMVRAMPGLNFLPGDTSIDCSDTVVILDGEFSTGQAYTGIDDGFRSGCNAGCHP